jgi:hypothetical protein
MTKFDTVYDKQCAAIWNLPSIENPTYRIDKPSWKGGRFTVMEMHIGWGFMVKSFATLEEAEQFIKELTA